MRSCNNCYCYTICRIVDGAVRERFEKKFGSLDELEEIWQKLGTSCAEWLDKEKGEALKKSIGP